MQKTSGNNVVSYTEYLINRSQGHPVCGLDSNGSFMLRFWNEGGAGVGGGGIIVCLDTGSVATSFLLFRYRVFIVTK